MPLDSPNHSDEGETQKKHNLTPYDLQKRQLDKLLERIDKPVVIPELKQKTLKPPKEIVRNVPGSSAGAGSGEFHIYRAHRRREYARTKIMEEEMKAEQDQIEFDQKREELQQKADEKTAKNRAKRQKRKKNQQTKDKKPKLESTSVDSNDTSNPPKQEVNTSNETTQ
ncbi:DUF1168-domain-containing protein [Basidiobolus meristosporus CBS 931.73]|uniref:DUF1168-domain-containing protein n=1 Tax=Basidiobolus meristosporus CBS 931.73 TaxID=1314790 RepID=A0A1Y1YCL3_9FUNG|nr:DUF1168-domain-containing protein [Basidiobolus meristosporus CBS 931.73]|eukprot:ORX95739.1 DUF1168-domain-containing protein [Basidiobolus meristosporus CBS 931.73]